MAWPDLPRYRCGQPGCPANDRRGVRVEGVARDDLTAAKAAYDAHQAAAHPELVEEETVKAGGRHVDDFEPTLDELVEETVQAGYRVQVAATRDGSAESRTLRRATVIDVSLSAARLLPTANGDVEEVTPDGHALAA
jgi:hypothetical protein